MWLFSMLFYHDIFIEMQLVHISWAEPDSVSWQLEVLVSVLYFDFSLEELKKYTLYSEINVSRCLQPVF